MEKTKEKTKEYFFKVFDFLHSRDNRLIKLCIIFGLVFLAELNNNLAGCVLCAAALFIVCEWAPSSMVWACVIGIFWASVGNSVVNWVVYIACIVMALRFILDCMAKKVNFKDWKTRTIAILYVALIVLLLLPLSTEYRFASQFSRVPFFTLITFMVYYAKEINIKEFLLVVVVSVVGGCLVLSLANTCQPWKTYFQIEYSKGWVNRFDVFLEDPNLTGSVLLTALVSTFILYRRGKMSPILYYLCVGVLGFFILRTISKANMLMFGVFALYVLIENIVRGIKTKDKKYLIELGVYFALVLIVCAIEWKYVDAFIGRFYRNTTGWWSTTGNGAIDEITTGRFWLWELYLKETFSSIRILLFGSGIASAHINGSASHSMPITYLYKCGILVCGLLIAIIFVGCIPHFKKCKVYNFVPALILFGIMCSLGSTLSRYFYVFAIPFLSVVWNGVEAEQTEEQIDIQSIMQQTALPDNLT